MKRWQQKIKDDVSVTPVHWKYSFSMSTTLLQLFLVTFSTYFVTYWILIIISNSGSEKTEVYMPNFWLNLNWLWLLIECISHFSLLVESVNCSIDQFKIIVVKCAGNILLAHSSSLHWEYIWHLWREYLNNIILTVYYRSYTI